MHSNAQQIDYLQVIPQLRSFLRSEVSTATQRRGRRKRKAHNAREGKGNGEKKDHLEAALSFFFLPQGIRLHQHAESQLIPSYIKPLIQTTRSAIPCSCVVNRKGGLHIRAQMWNLRRKQNRGPTVCANERKRNPYEMKNRQATETN